MLYSKKLRTVLIFSSLLTASAFVSCSNDASSNAKNGDSTKAKPDTIPGFFPVQSFTLKKFNDNLLAGIPDPITNERRVQGESLYQLFPLLKDDSGTPVTGFLFSPKDFAHALANLREKPATFFFSLAVSNVEDSADIVNQRKKPKYTIVVVPLNKDTVRITDPATGKFAAYDFTCPCPANTKCCPKDAASSTPQ